MRVTEGRSDLDLAQHLVQRSKPTVMWMRTQGIRWILMFSRQSYKVGDRHHFWGGLNLEAVGGGPGLVEALFERAAKVRHRGALRGGRAQADPGRIRARDRRE